MAYSLDKVRADLFAYFDQQPPEAVQALRQQVVNGRIYGRDTFNTANQCGCIIGHLATSQGLRDSLELFRARMYFRGADDRYVSFEQYIEDVYPGDKPATNKRLERLLGWIDEWLVSRRLASLKTRSRTDRVEKTPRPCSSPGARDRVPV